MLSDLQEGFRDAMGSVAAAVSVVTTLSGPSGDRPHGATVSAFTSLSMDPPMLLVSLQETSRLLALLTPGSHLGVNVLAAHQRDLALRFASRREDRFGDLDWVPRDGSPALAGAHAGSAPGSPGWCPPATTPSCWPTCSRRPAASRLR